LPNTTVTGVKYAFFLRGIDFLCAETAPKQRYTIYAFLCALGDPARLSPGTAMAVKCVAQHQEQQ
jgi:hypothetical protein